MYLLSVSANTPLNDYYLYLKAKMKTVETVNVKQLASHELSVEQQLYFKEITEVSLNIYKF